MQAFQMKKGVYWVGAHDWNIRDFHGYKTNRGSSYNAYLILDKQIVLVDSVKATHRTEMLERIKSIIDPKKIDIVVSNHVEMDHSGSIQDILQFSPKALVLTSPNGLKGLKEHYSTDNWNLKVVKSGEKYNIGQRNLEFFHIPMVHWPDSMVTYLPEEKLLFSNDAFGQHLAVPYLFDDQGPADLIFEQAQKYYANIVYPYSQQVKKALTALSPLDIEMIAPSHGIIWRTFVKKITQNYMKWADYQHQNSALIVYDTMWGSTEMLAGMIKSHFEEKEIPVNIQHLKFTHISDVLTDLLLAKYIFIGSPVLNNQVLPSMASFLNYIRGLRPQNKWGLAFGSFGWNPAGLHEIHDTMKELKWETPYSTFSVKYRPNQEDQQKLRENLKNVGENYEL